jgi:hypothetical protein
MTACHTCRCLSPRSSAAAVAEGVTVSRPQPSQPLYVVDNREQHERTAFLPGPAVRLVALQGLRF